MNVVAIVATKRKEGIISTLTKELLRGAKNAGHDTKLINLYDYRINYCLGCWNCAKTGRCVLKDDFSKIFRELSNADIIVLSAPVYFSNVPGIMKTFFDRQIGLALKNMKELSFLGVRFTLRFGPKEFMRNKKIIYITACTAPWPFNILLGETPAFFKAMNSYAKEGLRAKIIAKIVFTDSRFRNLKGKFDRYKRVAYEIGSKL